MSALWGREMLASPGRVATVRRLWTPDLGDSRTIFQDTRTSLKLWFYAMWWVTTQKNGASALGLQRVLGLKQYQTVWTWLHKLHSAMVRPGRDLLTGRVEVDETYLGGLEDGHCHCRARGWEGHRAYPAAADTGRLRREPPRICARLHPAGQRGPYRWLEWLRRLERERHLQEVTILKGNKETASELLPRVHRIVGLLKRWLMGTHQGAVSHKHLDYYLDKYTFRFNRRKSKNRGKLFFRLVQQAVAVAPAPYDEIVQQTRRIAQKAKPQAVGST